MSPITFSGRARRGPLVAALLVLATLLAPGCGHLPAALSGEGLSWPGSGPQYPSVAEDLRGAAAGLLSAAIRIDTTNPPGNETALARMLRDALEREGVDAKVVPLVEGEESREALWARVPGRGGAAPIVLLSHLDVVPADRSEWAVDPFGGALGAGYVVGRGALDAKGVAVVHALTLAELARRAQPLDRDVILLATPDEETGGRLGAAVVAHDRPELLEGARYLLTEGGGIQPTGPAGPDIWGVAVTEKTPCWVRVTARGLPGHGSSATTDPAPARLVRALARADELHSEVRVIPEVARMFADLSPFAAPEDREHYASLRGALALNPDFRERFLADAGRAALVRDTAVLTELSGGSSVNVVPAEASGTLDARLLPGDSCEAFVGRLRRAIGDPGVELDVELAFDAQASPVDTPLMEALRAVAARSDPPGAVVPRVIAGFTDAHWFRELGLVAYGFVPRRLRPIDTRGIHGPNERISTDNLAYGVRAMVEILEQLDRMEARQAPATPPAGAAR